MAQAPLSAESAETKGAGPPEMEGEAEHAWPEMSTTRQVLLVLTMTMCMMLNIMQVQSVQLALPTLGADLNIQTTNLQWLISSYSVAFGGLLLLFGRLADIYGHKKVFIGGMIWFVIWSIACGFAQNEVSIDFFRAMQGAALGAAIPSALGILGSSFPPGQRKTTAFALFSAGAPMGGSLGAVIGGVLTEYAAITWRAVFFVSTGIGALIGIAALFLVPPDHAKDKSLTVDWIGGALITSAVTLLTFALADGEGAPNGWRTPYIPTLLAVSIILFVVFWYYERHLEFRTPHPPLMRTSIWFKGRFAIVQLIGALGWSCFASYMFFCSLTFQDYMRLEPVLATVRFLPSSITGLILNLIVALLASRVPAHILITIGCLGTGLAPLLFAVQNYDDTYWQWQFPAMILSVFGADFIFACGILYVSHVAGHGHQALAGSLFNMSTQIGTGIGLAINTIVQDKVTARATRDLGMVYDPNARNTPLEAIHKGLNAAFYTCSGFAFLATLISATCLYGIGKVGHREKKGVREEDEKEEV
ncbi:hypothetical protein NBRC10512_000986 [Rhodotorula toruloides]|uniref:RHTO0S17e03202g1_1 n=2 Tax=Rhodotorula toruloides TaxID=5286 RepID=A0A061BKF5_RHOTO|nr:Major Facilitator Superfamily protein [Rhodotorula toruloides NP11]EMS20522.1 Major Facilitator Superfamily protein [Rhodotorula toruloides NP11]CDR48420.1 RHTO0S17e03202g1_1 [Rhodotorula toruloides]